MAMTPGEMKIYIEGLEKAQQALYRHIAALKMGGSMGRAVQEMSREAMMESKSLSHVWTSTLARSHVVTDLSWSEDSARGIVHVAPNANPVHGIPADVYAPIEHNRGLSHAFYARVVSERGMQIAERGANIYKRGF